MANPLSGLTKFWISMLLLAAMAHDGFTQQKETVILEYPGPLSPSFRLSKKLNETSGMIFFDEGLWTFNDSGGKAELYKLRTSDGVRVRTVILENAGNVDWEDITQDENYIYVADVGNNWGTRKDLAIYKIRKGSVQAGEQVRVEPEVIRYSYQDQKSFKPRNRNHNFDCEAIISLGDSLVLFSKNWVDNNTRMYVLPKTPGTYKCTPRAEFAAKGLVTGADYNAATGQLAFVGYTERVPFVYLFNDFTGVGFSSSATWRIDFPAMFQAQTEGICYSGSNNLAVSAENTNAFPQAVYLLTISELLNLLEKEDVE